MKQFNKLTEFRQAVYDHGLTRFADAQFDLMDALLLSPPIRSFPELSLSQAFRRQWHSAYAAIKEGAQDREWLEHFFIQQIPTQGPQMFSLDGTSWLQPAAKTMPDRQFVYSPTKMLNSRSIGIGQSYSVLAWAPERHSSWAPSLSVRRVPSEQTDVEVGVEQVKLLCRKRSEEMKQDLHLIVADAKYGNHHFLRPLKEEPCGTLVRLYRNRVLYGEPGPYSGRGRPRVHGHRFAFKEPETWGEPDAVMEQDDERWGKVRFRRWDHLHAHQEASTTFSVILVETHLEREKSNRPFWLGYQPPPGQEPGDQCLTVLWYGYQYRWPVEPSIRFRKQYLYWTLPRFQTLERCDRWTMLVTLAQWQLFLAREVVRDERLPWQPAQENLTPERVLQSLGGLFRQIDTPAQPPQRRGKSPGWPKGRPRTRKKRHRVVKKTKKTS
jgi:hypothetical protein